MFKLMTLDQEIDLVTDAKQGDINAQNQLLLYHEPFMKRTVAKYARRSSSLDFDDLLMAARYGLLHALTKFEVGKISKVTGKPIRFLSYAGNWIRNYIQIEVRDSTLIHVPAYNWEHRTKTKFLEFANRAWNIVPMDLLSAQTSKRCYEIADESEPSPYNDDDVAILHKALALIDPRLRGVIRDRYFMNRSLAQVAARLKVTREAVRMMQLKGVKALRVAWQEVTGKACVCSE